MSRSGRAFENQLLRGGFDASRNGMCVIDEAQLMHLSLRSQRKDGSVFRNRRMLSPASGEVGEVVRLSALQRSVVRRSAPQTAGSTGADSA